MRVTEEDIGSVIKTCRESNEVYRRYLLRYFDKLRVADWKLTIEDRQLDDALTDIIYHGIVKPLKKRLGETSYPPEVPSGKRLVVRSTGSGKPQQSQKPPSHVAVIPADSINIYEEIAEILERRGWPKSPHR